MTGNERQHRRQRKSHSEHHDQAIPDINIPSYCGEKSYPRKTYNLNLALLLIYIYIHTQCNMHIYLYTISIHVYIYIYVCVPIYWRASPPRNSDHHDAFIHIRRSLSAIKLHLPRFLGGTLHREIYIEEKSIGKIDMLINRFADTWVQILYRDHD